MSEELPIIQKTYDFIKWMVPILDRLPRNHRFTLGDRIIEELYNLLESLISARYAKIDRISLLQRLNSSVPELAGGNLSSVPGKSPDLFQ